MDPTNGNTSVFPSLEDYTSIIPSAKEFHGGKMSIWWDFENCPLPKDYDALLLSNNICFALQRLNYYGEISIHAYGDIRFIGPKAGALNSIGIRLIQITGGKKIKDASDKKMISDMMLWSNDNPTPANYLLISGDMDFKYTLDKLQLKRYNILVAHKRNSENFISHVNTVWDWDTLLIGGPPYVTKPISDHATCMPDIEKLDISEDQDITSQAISSGREESWKKRTGETSSSSI